MSRRGTAGGRSQRVRSTRPAVRIGPVIALSLVLLCVGWSLLWLFARHEAALAFGNWIEAERVEGRSWTCPNQRIEGFPLSITISCDQPAFRGAVVDGVFDGTLQGLSAEARLYFPTNVLVRLASPLQAREVDGERHIAVTWTSAILTLRGTLPGNLDHGGLQVDGIVLSNGDAGGDVGRIGHAEIGFRPMTRSMGVRSDLEANLVVSDARLPALDTLAGSADPLSADLKGFATQVAFDGEATLEAVLDPWTRAGGQVHVQSFRLVKGPFKAEGDGRLLLDEQHRLEGRLDTRFSGLEPIAERLGIPVGAVKIGGILSGLLGGGQGTEPEAAPAALTLPIVAKNGRLYVGPVKTGVVMLPLY